MITRFFRGQVNLLLKRCHILLERLLSIRKKLQPEIETYIDKVEAELKSLQSRIEQLLSDPDFGANYLLKNQIQQYRRYSETLSIIEAEPITVLDQYNNRDYYLYYFLKLFCQQIGYPEKSPLVSTHSTDSFFVDLSSEIIHLPLCEDCFLLALPDLIHELGHLFYDRNSTEIEQSFYSYLNKYIQKEKNKAKNDNSSKSYQKKFDSLGQAWMQEYIIEFSCDIFATYLVGTAYAWSNLRLILESNDQIYHPGFGKYSTHPADEARMRAILITLEELQGSNSTKTIIKQWEDLKSQVFTQQQEMEYDYCYPNPLLIKLAKIIINLCQNDNLISYYQHLQTGNNLSLIMQQAWIEFHKDSQKYPEWETQKIKVIKSNFAQS